MANKRTYIIVDIETTGGDPKLDRITEIAMYRYNGEKVEDSFVTLVNPEVPIPEHIVRITGINNEMVKDSPRFFEVAKRIVEISEGAVFVAHNVRFDYSFLQKEFRRLGYSYSRRMLCTVKLSRKLMPGYPSYSLGKLCASIGISIEGRHRAWGDASATLELFSRLLDTESGRAVENHLQAELNKTKLPPNLGESIVEELPDETGVYYFHDAQGEVIYVGKSTNIRNRVKSHFQNAHKAVRTMRMLDSIHDVSYELTGSELMALLLENEEIKSLQPTFNRAQRRTKFKFGIYTQENNKGYITFYVNRIEKDAAVLAGFTTRTQAESALQSRITRFELCPLLCGLEKGKGPCFHAQLHKCKGACAQRETPEEYNERARNAIAELSYGHPERASFLIISSGRDRGEKAVVFVKYGVYFGHEYLDEEVLGENIDTILSLIPYRKESPDVRRIIQGYVRKHPTKVRIIKQSDLELA